MCSQNIFPAKNSSFYRGGFQEPQVSLPPSCSISNILDRSFTIFIVYSYLRHSLQVNISENVILCNAQCSYGLEPFNYTLQLAISSCNFFIGSNYLLSETVTIPYHCCKLNMHYAFDACCKRGGELYMFIMFANILK